MFPCGVPECKSPPRKSFHALKVHALRAHKGIGSEVWSTTSPTKTEQLAGLPWVKYPSNPVVCSKIADACLANAEANRSDPEVRSYWLSQREYLIALASREQKLAA